jgi:hypothetical protein
MKMNKYFANERISNCLHAVVAAPFMLAVVGLVGHLVQLIFRSALG